MYRVDERDRVVELQGIPQSSVGAPIPLVFASEHRVVLAYYVQETPTDWDGSSARMVDPRTATNRSPSSGSTDVELTSSAHRTTKRSAGILSLHVG